jgi:hypothetical protein
MQQELLTEHDRRPRARRHFLARSTDHFGFVLRERREHPQDL